MANCIFPFIVNGKRFDDCTSFLDPDGLMWCSTRTNPLNDQHINGHGYWGFCNEITCPKVKGKHLFMS